MRPRGPRDIRSLRKALLHARFDYETTGVSKAFGNSIEAFVMSNLRVELFNDRNYWYITAGTRTRQFGPRTWSSLFGDIADFDVEYSKELERPSWIPFVRSNYRAQYFTKHVPDLVKMSRAENLEESLSEHLQSEESS